MGITILCRICQQIQFSVPRTHNSRVTSEPVICCKKTHSFYVEIPFPIRSYINNVKYTGVTIILLPTLRQHKDEKPKDWLHPAEFVRIIETPEDEEIQIYTDGSKTENGVGAGIAIFDNGKIKKKTKVQTAQQLLQQPG